MPHVPDIRHHEQHDPELIAAYAAGDASGEALELATTLVAGCPSCAGLHRDLRAIAAAVADLPAPVRTRDFTLSPDQAAALRPRGWRGLAALLAGPRFRLAAPLGTGLAALGLAGILLGSVGLPPGATGAGSAASAAADAAAPELAPAVGAAAGAAPVQGASPAAASAAASAMPAEPPVAAAAAPSSAASALPVPDGPFGVASAAGSAAPASREPAPTTEAVFGGAVETARLSAVASGRDGDAQASADRNLALVPAATPSPPAAVGGKTVAATDAPRDDATWLVASVLALAAGVALVAARLAARRASRGG